MMVKKIQSLGILTTVPSFSPVRNKSKLSKTCNPFCSALRLGFTVRHCDCGLRTQVVVFTSASLEKLAGCDGKRGTWPCISTESAGRQQWHDGPN